MTKAEGRIQAQGGADVAGSQVAMNRQMRPLLRTLAAVTLLALPATVVAQTLTTRDLVALAKAGLGDEVLIAMIEADQTVFRLQPLDVLELKRQGLSDRVLVRMIETARPPVVPAPAMPPRDSQPIAYAPPPEPEPRRRAEKPPVVVQQTVVQEVRVEAPRPQREYVQVPVYVPVVTRPRVPVREPEPVYWGFGGQRRPDAWKEPEKKDPPKKPVGGGG